MRAEFVPEWANPGSKVMRASFWPQRVQPVKPFSNPPLETRFSAAREEPAINGARQVSQMRRQCKARSRRVEASTGPTHEASRRMMWAEWRGERQAQGQNLLDETRFAINLNASGSFLNK